MNSLPCEKLELKKWLNLEMPGIVLSYPHPNGVFALAETDRERWNWVL